MTSIDEVFLVFGARAQGYGVWRLVSWSLCVFFGFLSCFVLFYCPWRFPVLYISPFVPIRAVCFFFFFTPCPYDTQSCLLFVSSFVFFPRRQTGLLPVSFPSMFNSNVYSLVSSMYAYAISTRGGLAFCICFCFFLYLVLGS